MYKNHNTLAGLEDLTPLHVRSVHITRDPVEKFEEDTRYPLEMTLITDEGEFITRSKPTISTCVAALNTMEANASDVVTLYVVKCMSKNDRLFVRLADENGKSIITESRQRYLESAEE